MTRAWLAVLLSVSSLTLAPTGQAEPFASAGADAVAALSERLGSFDALTARFEQRLYGGPSGVIESSGSLALARPSAFRWETELPYPQTVVTQSESVWVYDPDLEQVTVRPLAEAMADTPAGLLTGDADKLSESFRVSRVSEGATEEFLLRPIAEDSLYNALLLRFVDGVLSALEVTDHLGQMTQVEFSAVEVRDSLPAATFELELPADTDIIGGPGEFD